MQLVRLKGVKQDSKGTVYQMTKLEDDGDTQGDSVVVSDLLFTEETAPSAPAANKVILYCQDNGSGKTRLVAKFASGADVVIATQA